MAGESSISLGGIADRAEKLEAANAENKPVVEEKEGAAEEQKPPVVEEKKAPVVEEKKAPNDPEELRKWNTKVSMELSDVKKQLEALATSLNKTTKKQYDWKDLAKDPVKLQAAIEEDRKQAVSEATAPYEERVNKTTADYVKSEKERRIHDPAYPRWAELLPKMVSMAANADRRVNFEQHASAALDQMYELACQEVAAPAAAAPAAGAKTYTEAELATARETARKEALAEANKGLAAEEKGAGVGGMGKGSPKGANDGGVKKAAWNAPMADLKAAIQQATDNLHK